MKLEFESYGEVLLGNRVFIGYNCVFGQPEEQKIRDGFNKDTLLNNRLTPIMIARDCIIGNNITIYEGVAIGAKTVIDDYVRIGSYSTIGEDARLMDGAYIGDHVTIADRTRISGFICDDAYIGTRSSMRGNLLDVSPRPDLKWGNIKEGSPKIGDDVIVAWGANIIGAVRVFPRTYIAAGAIVTKDVSSGHIVVGINHQIPLKQWKGRKLDDLIKYWGYNRS